MGEARPFGRYLEDFEVGDVYKHWPGKTITEYDDHLFCMITMNHHPLHTNAHYAETQTQFGRNVVVGNLVYSLALGMSVLDVKPSGSKPDRGIVTVETRGYNQDGAEVLYFRRKVMVPKRGTVDEQPGRPEPKASGDSAG